MAAKPETHGELVEFKLDPLEFAIDNFVTEYELNDGEVFHRPNEFERLLIKDAIMGLIADHAFDAEWGKVINEQAERKAAALLAADKAGGEVVALRQENGLLRTALRFYANGDHYHLDASEEFDAVSGEPQNWLCSGVGDSETMVENGEVARYTLMGHVLGWEDAEEDHTPQPIAGESPFSAAALQTAYNTRPQPQACAWEPSEEQFKEWASRHGLHLEHERDAFFDAATLYLACSKPQPVPDDVVKDAERLDWIARQGDEFTSRILVDQPGDGNYYVSGGYVSGEGETFRAAIDAAMLKEGK